MKNTIFVPLCLLAAYITPQAIEYAFAQRGYFAFGGEWLILAYPITLKILADTVRDIFSPKKKRAARTHNAYSSRQ